jgi:hypothetical protein
MAIQGILIAFAVFATVRVFAQYRKQQVTSGWFATWTCFWVLVVIVVLVPDVTNVLAQAVGVGRGADLVVYVSLAVLFYSLFRLAARQEQQHHELTELVRKIAIAQGEKRSSKNETKSN